MRKIDDLVTMAHVEWAKSEYPGKTLPQVLGFALDRQEKLYYEGEGWIASGVGAPWDLRKKVPYRDVKLSVLGTSVSMSLNEYLFARSQADYALWVYVLVSNAPYEAMFIGELSYADFQECRVPCNNWNELPDDQKSYYARLEHITPLLKEVSNA